MALQVNIPLPGGIEHANGYVRAVKTITAVSYTHLTLPTSDLV